MNRVALNLFFTAAAMGLLFSNSAAAQTSPYSPKEILPPAKKVARVHITRGPELELAKSNWAIIRWTSNNPGGSDEHFGVVTYGTGPENLKETAKSHIRLNQNHSYTVFRVRIEGLKPETTYYYRVDSMQASGTSDGVKSPVMHFTTR
jgi:phosphodiesterase/alkaline phosphatase D-like protein